MTTDEGTMPRELGIALDALGKERGGKVACLVLVGDGRLELIYPGKSSPDTIRKIEAAIVATILGQDPI